MKVLALLYSFSLAKSAGSGLAPSGSSTGSSGQKSFFPELSSLPFSAFSFSPEALPPCGGGGSLLPELEAPVKLAPRGIHEELLISL